MVEVADGSRNKGKNNSAVKVDHVEESPCPARSGGNHVLGNHMDGDWVVTACEFCGETWGDLDESLNKGRRAPKEPT